jgi:hypothetical protein
MAAGSAVAVGAGAATGLMVAGMQTAWSDAAALNAASQVAAQPGELQPVHPVVVTRTEEEHITPDPVVIRKKVYRTEDSGGTGRATAPRPTPGQQGAAPSTASKPSRTVVAPAPKAPAASTQRAPAKTTSKAS